jgi:hypothetical protein
MPRHGIDFSPVRLLAEKTPFTCRILPDSVIGIPALLARYDFCASVEGMNATVECEVQRDGTLHGMGLWYTERLSSSVALSTAPGTVLPERLWPNHFFHARHSSCMRAIGFASRSARDSRLRVTGHGKSKLVRPVRRSARRCAGVRRIRK